MGDQPAEPTTDPSHSTYISTSVAQPWQSARPTNPARQDLLMDADIARNKKALALYRDGFRLDPGLEKKPGRDIRTNAARAARSCA